MPLIAKNIIKKGEEPKEAPLKPINIETPTRNTSKEGAVLIVNGRERKIGKKSQYLLDMLTLED